MGLEFTRKNSLPSEQEEQTLTSDRLHKAIERNRQRQLKRSETPSLNTGNLTPKRQGQAPENLRPQVRQQRYPPPPPPSSRTRSMASSDLEPGLRENRTSLKIRQAIPIDRQAKMQNQEFKRTLKSAERKRKWKNIFLKAVWLFHGYLLIRLAVSQGGALEYYDKQAFLQSRHQNLEKIQEDNKLLVGEIKLIKNDKRYQKKLVRDHLGFIAKDEYLVLFAQEKKR